MKLQAAILFAVTNAQRDGGRVRDKEVNSADVSDAFADYFGDANNAFGDYAAVDAAAYDAFGDSYEAFGDLSFGDYDASDYASDVASDDAGRPAAEAVSEDVSDDDGKTTFQVNDVAPNTNLRPTSFNAQCFNGVASGSTTSATKTAWFTAGRWKQCEGEMESCEIKVVRRAGVITQIQSKCANGHSCTDNALNNFNPKRDPKAGANTDASWYSQYRHQQCRPLVLDQWTAGMIGAREKQNDSTCFFCVEPCSYAGIENATRTSAELKTSQCVGRAGSSAANDNSQPINTSAVDIFDETSVGTSVVTTAGGALPLDAYDANFYGTVSIGLVRNAPDGTTMTENRVISRIQQQQLGL